MSLLTLYCRCDPVVCDITDSYGSSRSLTSFGRKRKKRSALAEHDSNHDLGKDDDVMVAGVIHISDQFELQNNNDKAPKVEWNEEVENQEINCKEQKLEFQQDAR